MNIILVSERFNPQKNIGGVRPYNFATELAAMGHKVFCVVSANEKMEDQADNPNLIIVSVPDGKLGMKRSQYETKESKNAASSENKVSAASDSHSAFMARLRREAAQAWFFAAENERYHNAYQICCDIMQREHIDIVLTSYGPISSMQVGLKLKKKYPEIPWVSDMRDPADSMLIAPAWRLRGAFLQRKMVHCADKVVAVCDGIGDRYRAMLPENAWGKVCTITNGYRESPILCMPAEDGILRIGYTGDGTCDMSELFRCLHDLEQQWGTALPIEVHQAGPDGDLLVEKAQRQHAEKYLIMHGMLSKVEALRLQEQCDILCVLTWNTRKEQGILTGKFFEYLRLRKPILAIITGNLANAELTKRIADLNIGLSYECVRGDADFPKMKQWLETCMEKKKANLPLIDEINEPLAQSYSYKEIAKQLEKVLCSLV